MSLLLSLSASSTLQLEGKSRTVQRLVLTAALTFAVALSGTTREVERVRGATLTAKASLQGQVREVERLRGSLTAKTALGGNAREIERTRGSLTTKVSLTGRVREVERLTGSAFTDGGGAHPVGVITRLSLDGYGARRTGSFARGSVVVAPVPVEQYSGGWLPYIKRTRYKFDYENEQEREKEIEAAKVVNQVIERSTPDTTLIDAEIALRLILRDQALLYKAIYMQWLEMEFKRLHKEQEMMIEEEAAIILMLSY